MPPKKKTLEKAANGISIFYMTILAVLVLASIAMIVGAMVS